LSDESLFREVDEEVRQEQIKKLWERHSRLVIALSVAVVAGVAGFKGWQYWQQRQAEIAGDRFFSALAKAEAGEAAVALEGLGGIDHAGFKQLASLREAGLLGSQGKTAEAVKIYDAVAADPSVARPLASLARLRAALALADTATPADLEARLKEFGAPGSEWRHAAREVLALAYWRAGDPAAADKQVEAILADPQTPSSLRQRAQTLRDLLIPALAKK
jgi:hypothetical protein